MMTERTLRVLEFVRIREMLAEGALTELGAAKCLELVPDCDLPSVLASQEETEEAVSILRYTGGHPMIPFSDVREALSICEKGATLTPRMLLGIAELLRASRMAKDALVTDRENTPRLTGMARGLFESRRLERDITDAILSEDEISDRASADLMTIRRHLRGAQERIREKLNQMIRSATMQKYLQEPILTVRNDRYVLPVRAEYRANVPGLVHDQSSSGATLFIEPMAAVEMGNELKQWEIKERQEIDRILAALSAETAPCVKELEENTELLAYLDFIFAKALLSRRFSCTVPEINDQGFIHIIRGRHPLLDPERAVPIDLWLGRDFTTLVITGPNTGGKTVTLKTVGLFTLMAQAGLQIPAELGTELAVFDQVFADIGDEQSIEQSLSTFSGHMTQIVRIMREVTPRDLVLFDELGAGTDPVEGAALAQSILTRLRDIHVRTLATTHYSELKMFALSTEGVENASVEFDIETLRPTYRLSIGIPGKSNAFEISKRLGLSDQLIENARQLLNGNDVRFEDVIANAEYHRQIAEREREMARKASQETIKLRDEAERLRRETEEKRQHALRNAREEARHILEKARQDSENMIAELKRLKKTTGAEGAVNALRKGLENEIDEVSDKLTSDTDASAVPETVEPGDCVKILTLGTEGTVISAPDERGDVQVQVGAMKCKAPLKQLRILQRREAKPAVNVQARTEALARTVPTSCDVRGMTLDEALPTVQIYLDEAVMAGLNEVTVIHGKGTGALRAGIQQDLKKNRHVKSYRNGLYGEGENGVTVVALK